MKKKERLPKRETLTAVEVAALLGLDPRTVRQRGENGEIPGMVRIGRFYLFSREILLKHLGKAGT